MLHAGSSPLSLLLMIAFAVAMYVYSKGAMKKLALVWQRAAELTGGTFQPAAGSWWKRTPMKILAELEGTPVHVDHYTVSHGKTSTTYTRIYAEVSGPPGLTLKVYVQGMLASLGKALGTQDIDVGDREFDDAFMVKSSDESLARLWLNSPKLRKAALATREYSLTVEKGAVTSIRVGIENDAHRLVEAMRAVALCAGRGRKLLKGWRRLAGELGGELNDRGLTWPGAPEAPIKLAVRNVIITVTLDPAALAGDPPRLGTRITAARAAAAADAFTLRRREEKKGKKGAPVADPFGDPAFAEAYTLTATNDARALRRFTDELRRDIRALDPAEITADEEEIAVVFDGAELRREPVEAAIAIAAGLAAVGSDNPYR